MNVEKRIELERKIVRHLIRTMKKNDWRLYGVDNGDGVRFVNGEKEAMEAVFAVDESSIHFFCNLEDSSNRHSVLIILGNGIDCIADHSYSESDNFVKLMDEVSEWTETLDN
jgi:hypothetical protein